jgi:hypothetical protein
MKVLGWIVVLLLAAVPAFGAKAISVAELKSTLEDMQKSSRSDADVATALKQLELSEQLTRATMNSLVSYVPGPLSTEQIYVLEARSALLSPPATDLPSVPAPDMAAQKLLLDKAEAYVTGTYNRLPALTATRTTVRFQDNVEATAGSSGLRGGAKDAVTGFGFSNPASFIHYINSTEAKVALEHGVEKSNAAEKDKTPWGANRMIALKFPDPALGTIFAEAQSNGGFRWLRWERVNGKPTAVVTFAVPRKKSHYTVDYCCFPDVTAAGKATFTSASTAMGGAGGANGNFQTATQWHDYKAIIGYHGEIYIDAESGIVVRMTTKGEFRSGDVVHEELRRVDYAPVSVSGKQLIVPMRTIIDTEVVPNGDSGVAGAYSERRTLFTSEYKDYAAQ